MKKFLNAACNTALVAAVLAVGAIASIEVCKTVLGRVDAQASRSDGPDPDKPVRVQFTTQPPEANIFVDGQPVGWNSIANLSPNGRYRIRIEKWGYQPLTITDFKPKASPHSMRYSPEQYVHLELAKDPDSPRWRPWIPPAEPEPPLAGPRALPKDD